MKENLERYAEERCKENAPCGIEIPISCEEKVLHLVGIKSVLDEKVVNPWWEGLKVLE